MPFITSYENDSNNILPVGEYECIIKSAFLNATKSGKEYFSIRFIVRNDVNQKYQNKNIYHAIWCKNAEKRTADDEKVGGFSYKQLMNLCKAAALPNGKSYENLNELGNDLRNRCVLVVIEHNEYNGEIQERVKWTNATKFPNCRHMFKDNSSNAVELSNAAADKVSEDDDLPF